MSDLSRVVPVRWVELPERWHLSQMLGSATRTALACVGSFGHKHPDKQHWPGSLHQCRDSNEMHLQLALLLLLGIILAGCATATRGPQGDTKLLAFLEDGRTCREEVLLKLGEPTGKFEAERILTYRVGWDAKSKGYFLVRRELPNTQFDWPEWIDAKYSLVLVFDPEKILRKHSLVQIK